MILENIKRTCLERGITIQNLEKEAGLSNGSVSKWKTCSPTLDKAKAVANVLGITLDELSKEIEGDD